MLRNSGCVEWFPAGKDGVAEDRSGVGLGTQGHLKLCSEIKLCFVYLYLLPSCFQLCFSEAAGEERHRSGGCFLLSFGYGLICYSALQS